MFHFWNRIKGSHKPRIVWAAIAILYLFILMYLNAIGIVIDVRHPIYSGILLAFMLIGILMLIASYMEGLDTWTEVITVFVMAALHVAFDVYMLSYMVQKLPIPIEIAQFAVEVYWLVGLLDILVMFWGYNIERIKGQYKSPEDKLREENKELEGKLTISEQRYLLLEQSSTSGQQSLTIAQQSTSKLEQQIEQMRDDHKREIEQIRHDAYAEVERMRAEREAELAARKAEAERTYTVHCELCNEPFTHRSPDSAERALRAHVGRKHSNGHHEPIPEITERGR